MELRSRRRTSVPTTDGNPIIEDPAEGDSSSDGESDQEIQETYNVSSSTSNSSRSSDKEEDFVSNCKSNSRISKPSAKRRKMASNKNTEVCIDEGEVENGGNSESQLSEKQEVGNDQLGLSNKKRSTMYQKRGLWAIKAKNGGVFPHHDPKPKAPAAAKKSPKFYPADDVKKPLFNKRKPKPTKLRASITPGTVLIILAGRFKGKRVVFLKQLPSGLLLVTGPFKINGVPLRRVNQSYLIGTSTKVDISGVNVDKFDDKYFTKEVQMKKKKTEGEFFEAEKEEKNVLPQEKKDDQKSVDTPVLKSIEAVPDLKAYLGARFSLKQGMKPHELVF